MEGYQPKPSALLDKLRAGEPVIVECVSVRRHLLRRGARAWMTDPHLTPYLLVHPGDLVEPADAPPDQCQW